MAKPLALEVECVTSGLYVAILTDNLNKKGVTFSYTAKLLTDLRDTLTVALPKPAPESANLFLKSLKEKIEEFTELLQNLEKIPKSDLEITSNNKDGYVIYERAKQIELLLMRKIKEIAFLYCNHDQDIIDTEAQQFWTNNFGDLKYLPWDKFYPKLEQYVNVELAPLKRLMGIYLNFSQNTVISFYELCIFQKWFGLKSIHNNLASIATDASFFGFLSIRDSEFVLKDQKLGTYMIRFSNTVPGNYAIDFVARNPEKTSTIVKHVMVKSCPNCTFQLNQSPVCNSLSSLIAAHRTSLIHKFVPYSRSANPNYGDMETVDDVYTSYMATCKVCCENPIDIVLIPCGHVVICSTCETKLSAKECPVCRQIYTTNRIFKA